MLKVLRWFAVISCLVGLGLILLSKADPSLDTAGAGLFGFVVAFGGLILIVLAGIIESIQRRRKS